MKTINHFLPKILLGTVLGVFLLNAYSCTQESVVDSEETPTAVNAVTKYGKDKEEDKVKRPWKISSSGTFSPDFSLECQGGLLPLRIEGSGEASHTGRFVVSIKWCTGGIGAENPNFITGTITTANGDKINFESVEFRPFEVDYLVTGGSGRFFGAEGAFTLTQTEFNEENGEEELPRGTYANEGGGYIIY